MRKVCGILLTQFIFTFSLILICQIKSIKTFLLTQIKLYIILISFSGFIFLLSFIIFLCKSSIMRKVPQNYIFLFLFTISETVLLIYISILFSFQCVLGSIIFIISICFVLFFLSCINSISLKYIYLFFIIVLFLGSIYGILSIIFNNYYFEFLYCLLGAIIFSLYFIYDTKKISQIDGNYITIDDYIFAAIMLYIDIIRAFIYIMRMIVIISRRYFYSH